MLLEKLRLFLKSRDYRYMFLMSIKSKVLYVISLPYIYVKAIYETEKLYRDYPDPWERHVKIMECKRETERIEQETEKLKTTSRLLGDCTCFLIFLLNYCSYHHQDNIPKEQYEELSQKFTQVKAEIEANISQLEQLGGSVPQELKEVIKDTEINRFTDYDEFQKFSDKVNELMDLILN